MIELFYSKALVTVIRRVTSRARQRVKLQSVCKITKNINITPISRPRPV